jgi:hypothetical protein
LLLSTKMLGPSGTGQPVWSYDRRVGIDMFTPESAC